MIIPQIIIAGLHKSSLETASFVQKVIRLVEEKFLEMDIKIFIAHEDFSEQELKEWIEEIATPIDFFVNIQQSNDFSVQFAHTSEEEIASALAFSAATRLGIAPNPSLLRVFTHSSEEEILFETLPLHTWNIVFPKSLSEKQLMINVMACITDIYTTESNLVHSDHVWPFRDVASSHFAFESIKKAKAKKVIAGYKGDIFYPNGGITRGEMFYILDKLGLLEN